MQQLHLVGFTTDLEGLIFSARRGAKSGSFVVPIDDKLVATIAEAHRRRNGDDADSDAIAELVEAAGVQDRPHRPPKPDSRLNPREIQGRLRAGRTVEEIAREAGVDTEWIERWAAPVMAEQQKIVARARGLVFSRSRGGPSVEPLGRSVAWNVADKGVWLPPEQFDRAWSAYQSLDTWIVRFRYRSRGREHVAEWEIDGDELIALDRVASQLAYLDRARRRKAPPRAEITEAPAPVEPTVGLVDAAITVDEDEEVLAPRVRRAKKSGGRATARKSRGAKKGPARKTAAKRSAKKVAAKKSVAKKAVAKKATGKKSVAKKAVAKKARAARKPARKAAPRKARAPKRAPAKKKAPAKKAAAKKAAGKKTAGTRKATRKAAGGRRAAGRRPPAVTPGVGRESRARLAASDMLSTEPDPVLAPRFGTSGNPPARRSAAGGKRTVVKARGKKKAAAKRPAGRVEERGAPVIAEPVEPETADVEELEAEEVAWQRATEAPPARRPARRQPRLRATVRRRERDDTSGASDAEVDAPPIEESATDAPARKGRARPQIAAERAGDIVGDGEADDIGTRETLDARRVFVDDDVADAGEGAEPAEPEQGAPEARRRRRFLRR